jgi:hypothetical protein
VTGPAEERVKKHGLTAETAETAEKGTKLLSDLRALCGKASVFHRLPGRRPNDRNVAASWESRIGGRIIHLYAVFISRTSAEDLKGASSCVFESGQS